MDREWIDTPRLGKLDSVGNDSAGTVSDRIGDTVQDPRVDVPPDLKGATVVVHDDVLTLLG